MVKSVLAGLQQTYILYHRLKIFDPVYQVLLALLFSPLAPVPKAKHEWEEGETLTSMKQTSCICCFDRRRFLERPVHNICSVTAMCFIQIGLHCVTAGLDVLTSGSTLTGMGSQQKILNMFVQFSVVLFPPKKNKTVENDGFCRGTLVLLNKGCFQHSSGEWFFRVVQDDHVGPLVS